MEENGKNTWDDFSLQPDLLRSIYSYGFEYPSNIQKKAIPHILAGRDLIAQAQSGTGKTGAFVISSLQLIDVKVNATQVIIIAPTHELVNQIKTVATNLSGFIEGLRIKTLVGGTNVGQDIRELRENPPHLVIGCTGRIYDMVKRKALNMRSLKLWVLDEADEMLSHGFKEQIQNIFYYLPEKSRIALFSATLPDFVLKLTEKFMTDPATIIVKREELSLEGIRQYYLAVHNDTDKYNTLKEILKEINMTQVIIYVNNVNRVYMLYDNMEKDGLSVCCIHSNMTKEQRATVVEEFRRSKYRIMVSSNITARGLDIQQVSIVINFDLTRSVDTYLHRIGRSGRWGRKGTAINFITRDDLMSIRNIERHYSINIEELPANVVF
jgi:superfamily II DNA/RNA helicase